ncbi:MAG: hypothetical protein M1838_001367 [Thelocarpon superellum]|nr:MAG: hypothetical protein M1838_001367 [Thelocarpon superellum]
MAAPGDGEGGTAPLDVEKVGTHATEEAHDQEVPIRKAVTAQDWAGPDDPENPMNWPFGKKVFHTLIPAMSGFTVTLGSSIITPAVPDLREQFNVGSTVAILSLTLYVLGLAFGPVLAAPLSESRGRSVVYQASLPVFGLFMMGAGLAPNFATLAICRFFAGMFGSPPLAVGAGTNADLWARESGAIASSLFILAPFLGPALGPTIGGFVVERKGWRWTQYTVIFFAIFCILCSLSISETYQKTILQRRAKRLGIPPPPAGLSGVAAIGFLFRVTLARPVHMLVTEPIVGFFSLYVAFNFAVLFSFFAAFPYVFQSVYHFNIGETGLTFLALGLGSTVAAGVVILLDRTFYRKQHHAAKRDGRGGVVAPEHRLYAAMLGSFMLPVGLFWFAWTARPEVHWISPVLAAIPFAFGNLLIFVSCVLYLIDTYAALNSASALAANGLLRYLLGAVFPLFTLPMYSRLGIGWATSLLGFIALALLPIPWVLLRWGPQIRSKSGYDTIQA